jgi:subtilisin family serine protease
MKRTLTIIAVAIAILLINLYSVSATSITPDLATEMNKAASTDLLRINIRMLQQFDASEFETLKQSMTREQRRVFFVNELKSFANQMQQPVLSELNSLSLAGQASNIQPLWIANVINCYATPAAIEQLALRSDIGRIDIDEERLLISPIDVVEVGETQSREITYNVSIMNVPEVWDMGITGEGVVVAVLDTGVNYNHVDLADNMWTHPDFPFHGWNFTNNTNNPMDFQGHGTHCAGTVAGNGTAGSQTGMAPNAKIMALQVLNSSGNGTESGVWAAIQFGVEYGADVLSLSLGWAHAWNPDRSTWRTAMNNALEAGVVASVAVGNEGNQQGTYPIPSNVRTPGDCPAPWRHPEQPDSGSRSAVVSVGATNSVDAIANFSSRGPVTWQNISPFNDYPYTPGAGLIVPDVVAPGVNVKSCSHSNTSGYTTMSGTSMATPGVAGVMALILSKNPRITPEEMSKLLEETAQSLSAGKSNVFGSGRVDALNAILHTPYMGPIYSHHAFNDETGNNDGQINPAEFIQVHLSLFNNSDLPVENVEVFVTTDSPYITLVDGFVHFGDFGPDETTELVNAFSFNVADNIPGDHLVKFMIEATDGDAIWKSEFVATAAAPRLVLQNIEIDDSQGNNNGKPDAGELITLTIQVHNTGQMIAANPTATLVSNSPFVSILSGSQNLDDMPAGETAIGSFEISISDATPLAEPVSLIYNIAFGAYTFNMEINLRVSELVEDFESGDFTHFDWEFAGSQPWTIINEGVYEGSYAARSGNITHNQYSQLILNMEVAQPDSIEFMLKVSSEPNLDFLLFFIDNTMIQRWSGEVDWTHVKFPVNPGNRSLQWIYLKNNSISQGSDAAWIDYIVLPQPVSTTAFAGQDAVICRGHDFVIEAIIRNAIEIYWESSGDGIFSATDIENPTYTPGPTDLANGSVMLSVSIVGADEQEKSDQVNLSFSEAATAEISGQLDICEGGQAEVTLHLTGTGPWVVSLGEEFDEIITTENQLTISLSPAVTTTYVVALLDGNACPTPDAAAFTINILDAPEAPAMPSGPAVIDYVEITSSSYYIEEIAHTLNYQWQLTPETAGQLVVDGKQVEINWNTDFIGQANLHVKAIGMCGESLYSESLTITLKNTIGLDEIIGVKSIAINPNPTSGLLNIELDVSEIQELNIVVSNQLGQIVFSLGKVVTPGMQSAYLDLSNLTNGIYHLRINGKAGSMVKRFVISK